MPTQTEPIRSAFRIAPLPAAVFALLAAGLVFEVVKHGAIWPAIAGLAGPDLALLLGAGRGLARGQLAPRAVPLYNALHWPFAPVALMLAGALVLPGHGAFIAGLAWAAHIAADRALGYGMRGRDGFQRGRRA